MNQPHAVEELELPPETAPEPLSITLKGFVSEEDATRRGNTVWVTVKALSRAIDLHRLDGVTVAVDYAAAVSEVDRGYATTFVQVPTQTSELVGVAMAVNVMRDGIVKAHLVFDAQVVAPILDDQHTFYPHTIGLIAHECAHVADLRFRDEQCPGILLRPLTGTAFERRLGQVAEVMWEEYAACRMSAIFCRDTTPIYAESLASVLSVARDRANQAIRSYRAHGDINRVLSEAGTPLFEPMRTAACLAGNLDGLGLDLESAPLARDSLSDSLYKPLIARMVELLRDLWDARATWPSRQPFASLYDVGCDSAWKKGSDSLSVQFR